MKAITMIDEEKTADITFPEEEVLRTQTSIEKRLWCIKKAIKLGKLFNDKVEIHFKDSEGKKTVNSVIVRIKDDKITLKHGESIPVCRILDIKTR